MGFHVSILTLFPEMFPGFLGHSLAGKALQRGDWSVDAINIRDFAEGVHKSVDDTPYGGGAGMVMRPDVIERALLSISCHPEAKPKDLDATGTRSFANAQDDRIGRKIYMSPRGTPLTQSLVKELSAAPFLTILCGRYEGVDQRVLDAQGFEEISIGDYVLSGGEQAAMIVMDACIRLLPGVMGNDATPDEESFNSGLLEYPHYTRPADWTAADGTVYPVPEVLKGGNHAEIAKWRRETAEKLTRERRPDLLAKKP